MAATREFEDRLLISVTDGKKLGELKDVYFDSEVRRMTAVFLGKTGLINRKALLIELSHIALFGIDAWLTDGSDIVSARDEVKGAESYLLGESLRGREIQTDGGTKIGVIGDIIVDESHKVLGFALSKVHAQGPLSEARAIAREAITSLGDDNTPMRTVLEQAEKLKLPA
ncbi:MAG: PRC-barrel domain-containing protein [Blastocatellia bacterium]